METNICRGGNRKLILKVSLCAFLGKHTEALEICWLFCFHVLWASPRPCQWTWLLEVSHCIACGTSLGSLFSLAYHHVTRSLFIWLTVCCSIVKAMKGTTVRELVIGWGIGYICFDCSIRRHHVFVCLLCVCESRFLKKQSDWILVYILLTCQKNPGMMVKWFDWN